MLITQLLISFSIKIPLGMMWNLLNIMQVVAYLRLFANWTSNVKRPLDYIWEAITMTKTTAELTSMFKSKYEKVQENISSKSAQLAGIENASLFKSLGIFGIAFFALCILVVVYLVIKRFGGKSKFMINLQFKLKSMLFYNAFIRYMIKSNLILTHNNLYFLLFLISFNTISAAV